MGAVWKQPSPPSASHIWSEEKTIRAAKETLNGMLTIHSKQLDN